MEKRNKHYSMPESINNNLLQSLNKKLQQLHTEPGFSNAVEVVNSVIALLGVLSDSWKLFNDDRGKIKSNSGWFMVAEGFADRRATYKISDTNEKNIDFKAYWLKKISKSTISWVTALTPNFEDEPFYQNKNIGIDFVISPKADKVVVVLTKNYSIRTLELTSTLTTTQYEIFAKWLQSFDFTNKAQTHQILWDSFDLESVNRQFYKQISAYFTELKQYLTANCDIEERSAAHFTNRLIGRMVFCWFLLKKGIINGNISYFDPGDKDSTSYYKEKLEVLFFKVFNTPQQEREPGIDAETPFLNGGLFEPRKGDFVNDKRLSFPSDYFNRLIQTLSHYNFTTDESTSTFQQVAIDPEMLGRIFENLLAEQVEETGEQARKAKGAFYTPREIVDYMCRESLREYLKSKIPDDEYRDQRISELLDKKPHEIEDKSKTNLRRDLKSYKEEIIKALDDLTVLDPACGSGAFPMGMMHLLAQCYERLEPRFEPYKTKLGIIKNNIFGVDIEPMAIEISRLRAWLSIIVDEDSDSKKIEPLPNLDFKFVCANSLIPLENDARQIMDDPQLEVKMQDIRNKYFNARSYNSKTELRKKFDNLTKNNNTLLAKSHRQMQLESYKPFDSENVAHFFDSQFMFGIKEFDMILGNPPYLRIQGIQKVTPELATRYKQLYKSATGAFDLYVLFIEKGLNLLQPTGILNYILPHKWTNSTFGSGLRTLLHSNKNAYKMISFGAHQVFTASNYTSLLWLTKNSNDHLQFYKFDLPLNNNHELELAINKLGEKDLHKFDTSALNENSWILTDKTVGKVIEKLMQHPRRVHNIFEKIFQGIATSDDKVFVLRYIKDSSSSVTLYSKALNREVEIEKDFLKPFLMGKDVSKYKNLQVDKYIIFPYKKIDGMYKLVASEDIRKLYPLGWEYLTKNITRLKLRENGTFENIWWCYSRPQNMDFFENQKIITPEISIGTNMAFDEFGTFFHTTKCYSFIKRSTVVEDYKYFLGILNSSLLWFFLKHTGYVLRGGYFTFKTNYLEPFPIPEVSDEDVQQPIIDLVTKILELKQKNSINSTDVILDYEKELNQLVYQLYGLTKEEIKIIESE